MANYQDALGCAKACIALTNIQEFDYTDNEGTKHTYYEVCFRTSYGLLCCRISERHVDYVREKLHVGELYNIIYLKTYHNRLTHLNGFNLVMS